MRRRNLAAALALAGALAAGIGMAGVARLRGPSGTLHPRTGLPIQTPGQDEAGVLLFNGWRISPAGRHMKLGDMPLGGAISPDGRTLAIANSGYNAHRLSFVDVESEKLLTSFPLARSWNGIAWSPEGNRIYVAGGISNAENDVYLFEKQGEEWKRGQGFKLSGNDPKKTCIAGLALSPDGATLYALNNSDNHLYALRTDGSGSASRIPVGDHPVVCRVSPDGRRLYAANWGAGVAVVSLSETGAPGKVVAAIKTGAHPNDLAISRDGRLFVSCGNADEVDVIDTEKLRVTERIKTSLTPKAPPGSTPNALALSPDLRTLYAANADNNSVCVIDVSLKGRSRVSGFIPTGWYPSAVHVSADGRKVIIASGKGVGTLPNPARKPIHPKYPVGFEYIGRQLNGMLSFVDVTTPAQLAAYTRRTLENSPYRDTQLRRVPSARRTAIPDAIGQKGPIKYVLYIIKENRTYDQVFGDIPTGNGDPELCLFGRDVTPNQHALAEQFVLLDNLYCNGEVSADGHPWSTSAYATDFTQRSWVLQYSQKGQTVGSETVEDPGGGYIWEACARKGIRYRSYGEYANHPSLKGNQSDRFIGKVGPGEAAPGRDTDRADIFLQEFREFERRGTIPRFMIMSLGENHTNGTRPGSFTPKAMVASNDLAVGKIVEALTHSSVWKELAIFIIEDDAQNGPDHVDSHRTVGLVISPYARRKHVDSTMYSTASMLRTMELILGLDPLTQYDAAATPMFESFRETADLTPFRCLPPQTSLTERNPSTAYGARESAAMDFSEFDRIDEQLLNRILWHSIKGVERPMPPIIRRYLQP